MPGIKFITATLLLIALVTMAPFVFASPGESEKAEPQESAAGSNVNSVPSVLQVSGTTNNFVVSAQHADVLSLLKLVFAQAHRQFVPDASVMGNVTFSLSGQKFETVLSAVCRQAVLRYEIDRNGIYQFRRDDEALRTMLLKTRTINGVIMDQLRGMGYTIRGEDTAFGKKGSGGREGAVNDPEGPGAPRSLKPFKSTESMPVVPRISSPNTKMSLGTTYGLIGAGVLPNLEDNTQYQKFLKQNSLGSVNTKGEDMAVRDILLDIGRQAGVAILIDPAVPNGKDFVLNGSIPARPIGELLNILAYKAHLEWRWVNNQPENFIFVTTTPQLQFYLRGALLPLPKSGVTVLPPRAASPPPNTDKKTDNKTDQDNKEKPKGKE